MFRKAVVPSDEELARIEEKRRRRDEEDDRKLASMATPVERKAVEKYAVEEGLDDRQALTVLSSLVKTRLQREADVYDHREAVRQRVAVRKAAVLRPRRRLERSRGTRVRSRPLRRVRRSSVRAGPDDDSDADLARPRGGAR